jgi:hypothetical protein
MTPVMSQTILNKELIHLHQSILTPPGKRVAYWSCSELLKCEVWGRRIDDSSWMVILLNRGKKSHNITVDWKVLGLQDDQVVDVYDVWNESSYLGNRTGSFTSKVPSHGTSVIRIQNSKLVQ